MLVRTNGNTLLTYRVSTVVQADPHLIGTAWVHKSRHASLIFVLKDSAAGGPGGTARILSNYTDGCGGVCMLVCTLARGSIRHVIPKEEP